MAKGTVNKVILIGRIGNDIELRYTQSGTAVCDINIATNRSFKKNDEWQEETEWTTVTLWDRKAEVANEYAGKGSRVYVEGYLKTEEWEQDGNKRYRVKVVATDFQLLDNKSENGQPEAQKEAPPAAVSEEDVPF